jgi:hypothetical protein
MTAQATAIQRRGSEKKELFSIFIAAGFPVLSV